MFLNTKYHSSVLLSSGKFTFLKNLCFAVLRFLNICDILVPSGGV
nr:MAG TPA: hypothetical protein [Bacteriophage sp.]